MQPYLRMTCTLQDTTENQKKTAALVTKADAEAAKQVLSLFCEHETEEIQEEILYTLDIINLKGSTYQELRTLQEAKEILAEYSGVTPEEAEKLLLTNSRPENMEENECVITSYKVEIPHKEYLPEHLLNPDDLGESSYRAACNLAVQALDLSEEYNFTENKNTRLEKEHLKIIDTEMGELVSSALSISKNQRPLTKPN